MPDLDHITDSTPFNAADSDPDSDYQASVQSTIDKAETVFQSEYRKTLKERLDRFAEIRKHHAQYGEFYERMVCNLIGVVRAEPYETDLTVHVSGDKHTLEADWRKLRVSGFSTASNRPKPNDPSWTGRFDHPNGSCIWIMFASTVCRRVKVGTKTVEQDVFETVCGEHGENNEAVKS